MTMLAPHLRVARVAQVVLPRVPLRVLSRRRRRIAGLASVLLATIAALPAAPALAQGTDGRFPLPRRGVEIARWLEETGATQRSIDDALELHARYLERVERLRDDRIEAWLLATPPGWTREEEDLESKLAEATARRDEQRRLIGRLEALEDELWNEIAARLGLAAEVASSLRDRGRLQRLGGRDTRAGGPAAAGLASLLAACKATPEEAARIRDRLVGHDARLATALEAFRDEQFDAERRNAEQQLREREMWAETRRRVEEEIEIARREGREARTDEIHNAAVNRFFLLSQAASSEIHRRRGAAMRLRLDAVRTIDEVLGDPDRTAAALATIGVSPNGPQHFFRSFLFGPLERLGRDGGISAEQAEKLEALRARSVSDALPQRLELAELEIRRLELGDEWFIREPDGSLAFLPEMLEISERSQALFAPDGDVMRRQMAIVVEVGRIVGTKRFAEAIRGWGRMRNVPEAMIEGIVEILVAGVEAGRLDADKFQREAMLSTQWSAPPAWKAMGRATLSAMLDDLEIPEEMRTVARQLLEDGSERFRQATAETAASFTLPEDFDLDLEFQYTMLGIQRIGPNREKIAATEAGLRLALAADEAFFAALVDVFGEGVRSRLRPWRAMRRVELIAACEPTAGVMWNIQTNSSDRVSPDGDPFTRVDLFRTSLVAIPETLDEPAIRMAFATEAERLADLERKRWTAIAALLPRMNEDLANTYSDVDDDASSPEENQRSTQRMLEAARELDALRTRRGAAVREARERLAAALPPDAAALFRRATLRAAWSRTLGDLEGRSAVAAARRRALDADDPLRAAEVEAIARRHDEASDRIVDELDEAFQALRDETAATEFSEHQGRWRRTVERARFRHGELDFATARAAGAVAAARTRDDQR